MKVAKKVALALLVVFVAMQFYRPQRNQEQGNHTAQFISETNPPKNVKQVLTTSCYDCHSNSTTYPWYNNVAPVSYWLSKHIKNGKKHLNFSAWNSYSDKKKEHKLEEISDMIETNEMPLQEYLWTHKEAKISEAERAAIIAWAKQTRALYQLNQQPQ